VKSTRRTFVAAEVPAVLRAELAAYAGRHPAAGVRWLPEENLHLTVQFLGSVAADALAQIERALAAACGAIEPFPLTVARIAPAPPKGRPRMVWVYFEQSAAYAALAGALFDALRRFAPQADPPRPHPHLTLARFARGGRPRLDLEVFAPADPVVPIDGCTLFESRPGPKGSTYVPLARADLVGGRKID
jgi:RNA 2',3'-cyclic 3'-phosphodiesterase